MTSEPPPAALSTATADASAPGAASRALLGAGWRWAGAAAVLVLLLCGASLTLVWQLSQRFGGLERELVSRQMDSAAQASEARMLAKQAQDGMLDAAAKQALLEARLAEVAVQRGQLEELLQSLSRSRDENMLVDIEAAIRVAVQHNAITGSAEPLISALKQSDERLLRHGQPKFEGVRRAIARDLDRVRAAGVADVSTLTIRLDEAMRLVDDLPLLSSLESRKAAPKAPETGKAAETSKATDAAKPGGATAPAGPASASAPAARGAAGVRDWSRDWANAWEGAWQRVLAEARSLVRVTTIEHADAMLLAPEQAFFLKENLKLRLMNARLAVLSRQFEIAQADLGNARGVLERYFDRGAKRTLLAIDLVKQAAVQARQVGVPRPDDTLAALAAAGAGR